MIEIEPLGTGCVLPAFVVGYELMSLRREMPEAAPIVCVCQQAGGRSMRYPNIVGVVLRLAANRERGPQPMDELIRGLKGMAEDPDMTVLADFPVLKQLVLTFGEDYKPEELRRLESFIRRFVRIPVMKSGFEALIRFEACNPLDYFNGWNIFYCMLKPEYDPTQNFFSQGMEHRFDLKDDGTFDERLLRQVEDIGGLLNRPEPPGVFLLWENSD